MKTNIVCGLALFLLIVSACSRPPKVVQAPAKAAADATLRLAQTLESQHRFGDSRQTYQSALNQYRSFGDLRGSAYALAGLARAAYANNNEESYHSFREELEALIKHGDPEAAYVPLLLDLYIYNSNENYAMIKELANDSYDYDIHNRIQILTYAVQADTYLNPGFISSSAKDLERLSRRYRGTIRKDVYANPTVLSAALYALAYHSFVLKEYPEAEKLISEAEDLDSRYENFPALGYDYWLRANILENNRQRDEAKADYIRAQGIFTRFENTEMLLKTEAALKRLKGE